MDQDEKEVELRKLAVETTKARWTAAAVIVSVLSGAATITYGAWSVHQTAEAQFITKIAEVVFNTDNPNVTANKGASIAYLFGAHLPPDIRSKLQDRDKVFDGINGQIGHGPPLDDQKELFRMVLEAKPTEEKRVTSLWKRMWPEDSGWVDKFAATGEIK